MTEPRDEEIKALIQLCDDAVMRIGEHADSVQLFITKSTDDGTRDTAAYEFGRGNIYTRQGQVAEWLVIQTEYQRQYAIKKSKEKPE